MIPDITFRLAKENAQMALFSPYDVQRRYGKPFGDIAISERYDELIADPHVRKTYINARDFFQTLAEIQFESGYPYIMFEDTVNRANPIAGRINMSNLCSEILQVNSASRYDDNLDYTHIGHDISCNLGSLNIAHVMDSPDIGRTVETAIRGLTAVSDMSHIRSVPSIAAGNAASHAIGLGQMNLHGYLAREGIAYGSPEALDFTNLYFYTITWHAVHTSMRLARERGKNLRRICAVALCQRRLFYAVFTGRLATENGESQNAICPQRHYAAHTRNVAKAARRCDALWHL